MPRKVTKRNVDLKTTQERTEAIREAIDTNPKTLKELSDMCGLPSAKAAEVITERIRQHDLILWDGQRYFRPKDINTMMDFAAEHPQHFQAVLCVWRLGYNLRIKTEEKKKNDRETST